MSRRLLAIAAAAALTFTFAACDVGGDGPVTEPPEQVSTSDGGGADPSDGGGAASSDNGGDDGKTVAAADIPAPDPADYAGMDEHTADGATQAFRYYIAVSMWAHQTGETRLLETLQTDDCEGCNYLNKDISSLQEHEKYWGKSSISDIGALAHDSDTFEHEIGYQFTLSPHTRPTETFEGKTEVQNIKYNAVAGLNWVSGQWIVGGMSIEWGTDVGT